ncbi:sigma-70 family RNA polymerase sigma factor [Komagataeibacter oboediens]|uniref:sigma-70 family RNA polymerase sigma factor n=1 Tax=Komagataeibacter oboediens TaxID=65958 RepID=UPI001FD6277F|nr:sigma-70 family RNA polymerase sigma factor [Komagataeibacter oboediens]
MAREGTLLALYSVHRRDLVNYAKRFTGDLGRAEDIVQEAWLRLEEASRKSSFHAPRSYLYSIVRNLAFDGSRRERREGLHVALGDFDTVAKTVAAAQPDAEQVLAHHEEIDQLRAALAELPERMRIAFEMHRFGDRKLREIAAFLGISVASAGLLVTEALEHCKERLNRS